MREKPGLWGDSDPASRRASCLCTPGQGRRPSPTPAQACFTTHTPSVQECWEVVTMRSEPCRGQLLGPLGPPLLGAGLAESNENSPLRPRATTGLLCALCPGSPQKGSALALQQLRNTCLPVLRKSTAAPSFPLLCLPRHWLGPHPSLTCCPWEQIISPAPSWAHSTAGSRHSGQQALRAAGPGTARAAS